MFARNINPINLPRFTLAILFIFSTLGLSFLAPRPAYAAECQAWYTVQRGENLYRIGLKYDMTWDRITSANNLSDPDKIYAGQVLCIPVSVSSSTGDSTVLTTDVEYVKTLTDVYMRGGPGTGYDRLGTVKQGQVILVTGISKDGNWWRVVCFDNTMGDCWITANAQYTQPTTKNGTPTQPTPNPVVVPTISILSVKRDQTVTLQAVDFPAGMKFKVLMGPFGSAGVNGYEVTTTDSGAGGSFKATYTIPEKMKGSLLIAIRLESTSGYYSYNWFWNTTSD
jgi:LysM repeat protein